GDTWWIWGFALLFAFQLLMLILYPKLILPLFNKLTPLPEGELRSRLMALGDRFRAKARAITERHQPAAQLSFGQRCEFVEERQNQLRVKDEHQQLKPEHEQKRPQP